MTKQCSKCKLPRPLKEFLLDDKSPDIRGKRCETCRRKGAAQKRQYRKDHPEKRKAERKAYRKKHPKKRQAQKIRYRKKHLDEVNKYHRTYNQAYYSDPVHGKARRERRLESILRWQNSSINYRLRCTVAARVRKAIRNKGPGLFSSLGYTVQQLKNRLEALFLPGMSWDNYGEWEIDHIVPHRKFGYTAETDPEFRACWALTNLQPLWKPDNRRKH